MDQIVKKVVLKASLARVWRAIADSQEFGAWFGMRVDGAFTAGKKVRGTITPTQVDPEVAKMQKPHEGTAFELEIVKVDPEREFSFRWHPFAVDKSVDYATEPTTLVAFALAEVSGGVQLTITESGFDELPLERRAKAFQANEGGWTKQCELIEKYLAQKG